jgi:L-ascorbate metabolism protein UlaG (beta-lactamase superfamily)
LDIVHLGDLGVKLNPHQQALLGKPDVLLLPVGGTYTLGPEEAASTAEQLEAGWIVPMHGYHPKIDLPLRPISDFVEAWQGEISTQKTSHLLLDNRPKKPTVVHLDIL